MKEPHPQITVDEIHRTFIGDDTMSSLDAYVEMHSRALSLERELLAANAKVVLWEERIEAKQRAYEECAEQNDILSAKLAEVTILAEERRKELAAQGSSSYVEIQKTCGVLEKSRDSLRQQLEEAKHAYAVVSEQLDATPILLHQLEEARKKQPINTSLRLFDLVRFMRSELLEKELITEAEYSWLAHSSPMATTPKGGSPSRERLEEYDDLAAQLAHVTAERDEARAQISSQKS